MNKQELRSIVRSRKRAMTEEMICQKSMDLTCQLQETDLYRNARSIYGYLPYNQEVRTVALLQQALREGKRVAVPKCYGDEMRFIWMEDLSRVEKGYAGIPEPVEDGPVADDETALVLMPGMAFTTDGKRMGYGGGFYDKFLAAEPDHPTVALCYDFQMVEDLPTEEYDIPVDCVLWA